MSSSLVAGWYRWDPMLTDTDNAILRTVSGWVCPCTFSWARKISLDGERITEGIFVLPRALIPDPTKEKIRVAECPSLWLIGFKFGTLT